VLKNEGRSQTSPETLRGSATPELHEPTQAVSCPTHQREYCEREAVASNADSTAASSASKTFYKKQISAPEVVLSCAGNPAGAGSGTSSRNNTSSLVS
jgi:hypothetical protein